MSIVPAPSSNGNRTTLYQTKQTDLINRIPQSIQYNTTFVAKTGESGESDQSGQSVQSGAGFVVDGETKLRTVMRTARKFVAKHGRAPNEEEFPVIWRSNDRLNSMDFDQFRTTMNNACKRIRKPLGEGGLGERIKKARAMPEHPLAARYTSPRLKLVVNLCKVLSDEAGGGVFWMAAQALADEIGGIRQTAADWLGVLMMDGVIERTYIGHSGRASEYRWLGGDKPHRLPPDDLEMIPY